MKNRNFIVGLFVVAGLTLFTIGLFLIGNRHEVFARHVEYYTEFTNLAGLTKGAKVQVDGMDAGQIMEIGIPSSPVSRFRVRVRINETMRGLVRADSVATIGTEGVVGNTFLSIRPGSSHAPAAAAQATLPSKEPTELADLLDQGKGVLTDADGAIRNANGLLTTVGGNLDATLTGVKTTIGNVNDVVVGLKQGRGPAGMLLQDQAVATQIRQTISNAQLATVQLGHVSSQADTLLSDIQSRQFPGKIDETLGSVRSAATNLDAGARELRQTIAEATGTDAQGLTAGVNIRESLSNANAATANLADETEALKHNFLLRGFFRRRGYFNLTHLSPETYRTDRLFTNPANGRAWLPADKLFVRDANGLEQLTNQGKGLLDGVVAQYGDAIVERPIVVEGYWSGDNAAAQLARSRSRSILVRSYLETHFQLDPSHLGAVAMKNLPPAGFDHPAWDGICIVVIKGKS